MRKLVTARRKKGKYRNAKDFQINQMNNRVLVKMRFKRATDGIRSLKEDDLPSEVQKSLDDLVSFRNMENTLD